MENNLIKYDEIILNDFGIVGTPLKLNDLGYPNFKISGLTEQSRIWLKINPNILVSALYFKDNGRRIVYDIEPSTISSTERDFILSELNSVKQQILNRVLNVLNEKNKSDVEDDDDDNYDDIFEKLNSLIHVNYFVDSDGEVNSFMLEEFINENYDAVIDSLGLTKKSDNYLVEKEKYKLLVDFIKHLEEYSELEYSELEEDEPQYTYQDFVNDLIKLTKNQSILNEAKNYNSVTEFFDFLVYNVIDENYAALEFESAIVENEKELTKRVLGLNKIFNDNK